MSITLGIPQFIRTTYYSHFTGPLQLVLFSSVTLPISHRIFPMNPEAVDTFQCIDETDSYLHKPCLLPGGVPTREVRPRFLRSFVPILPMAEAHPCDTGLVSYEAQLPLFCGLCSCGNCFHRQQ